MNVQIQDGVYDARLIGSEVRLSGNGKPMICFLWKLNGSDTTIKSFVHLCLKDGSPNVKGINLVKSWAKDWDGGDLYWFTEHASLAASYEVKLTIANEPAYNNPSQIYPRVKWVNAAHGRWGKQLSSADNQSPTPLNRDEFKKYLETVRPTMQDVWLAFRILYAKATQTSLERAWFEMIDRCRPEGRDVDQFTESEWQHAIDYMAAL